MRIHREIIMAAPNAFAHFSEMILPPDIVLNCLNASQTSYEKKTKKFNYLIFREKYFVDFPHIIIPNAKNDISIKFSANFQLCGI